MRYLPSPSGPSGRRRPSTAAWPRPARRPGRAGARLAPPRGRSLLDGNRARGASHAAPSGPAGGGSQSCRAPGGLAGGRMEVALTEVTCSD